MKDDNGNELGPVREAQLRNWNDVNKTLNFIRNISNLIGAICSKVPPGSEIEADLLAIAHYADAERVWVQASASNLHDVLTAALDSEAGQSNNDMNTIH